MKWASTGFQGAPWTSARSRQRSTAVSKHTAKHQLSVLLVQTLQNDGHTLQLLFFFKRRLCIHFLCV